MKFQHFIRSQKRRADSGLRDHDMQWGFWTLSPETAHQVTWLMGSDAICSAARPHLQTDLQHLLEPLLDARGQVSVRAGEGTSR